MKEKKLDPLKICMEKSEKAIVESNHGSKVVKILKKNIIEEGVIFFNIYMNDIKTSLMMKEVLEDYLFESLIACGELKRGESKLSKGKFTFSFTGHSLENSVPNGNVYKSWQQTYIIYRKAITESRL